MRKAAAFVIGVFIFPIYVILARAFFVDEPPWEYTKWVFMLFYQSDGYVRAVLVTLLGALLLSAVIGRFASAKTATWCLAGFVAASIFSDPGYLTSGKVHFTYMMSGRDLHSLFLVWAPLAGVLAGYPLGIYLNRKRHIADVPTARA